MIPTPFPSTILLPVRYISCSPSVCFKSTTTRKAPGRVVWEPRQADLGHAIIWVPHVFGVLKRVPAKDQKSSLPKCRGPPSYRRKRSPRCQVPRGPGFAQRRVVEPGVDAEGSVSPRLSADRDSSEQPLWLNWGEKEAAGKGERGITLRNLLAPNR